MNAEAEKAWVQLKGVEKAVKQAVVEIDRAMKKPNIDPGEKDYMDKLKEALKNEQENIEDFEALIKGGVLKIGVFGSPSRGKSTLLNALLGIDMLPMDGKHGTTRFGTRLIKRKEIPNPKKPYKVERILTGAPPESKDCDAEDVSTVLKYFADKEAGEKNSKTKRIDIEGPFDSFIDDDLIFIDTPGISEPSESSSNTGHDFERDRKYALEILSSVDIVIFCLRADAPERDDVKLYNETFFDKYEPINVITFANERDDMTILDLKRYLKETYHLMLPDTVAVDAKKAVEIVAAAKKEGKRIKDEFEAKLVGENLVGFKELKELIHERVGHKDEHIGKRVAKFKELYNDLKSDANEQFKLVLPEINEDLPSPATAASDNRLLKMVGIPAGSFLMGSPKDEIGRDSNEGPQRTVTLSAFYMCKSVVTQDQWKTVMGGSNPSKFSTNPAPGDALENTPVENVSWYDVIAFANRLSKMEGLTPAYSIDGSTDPDAWGPKPSGRLLESGKIKNLFESGKIKKKWDAVEIVPDSNGYRLPTEAQWEYAARAGTTTAFSNDAVDWKDETSVAKIGWFEFNSRDRTREVGQKVPNGWGLQGMHGNVKEWVWDWFGKYPAEDQDNPLGPPSGSERVARSGGWGDSPQFARSASRTSGDPVKKFDFVGFRLVRPLA